MPAPTVEAGTPYNLTASGAVGATNRPATLLGFYVNSTTAGTVVLNDASTAKTGTITPAIGWHSFPASFPNGLQVTIGGTLNVTFVIVDGFA